jgi:uncharacterized protein
MNQRIIGFDLARAYAIFGMFIVNFNTVFGDYHNTSYFAKFLSLFNGNSSTVFIMLSGMGLALMSNKKDIPLNNKKAIQKKILIRAVFLFTLGMLLNIFWPADILHFYGCYMAIASTMIFLNKNYFLLFAFIAILVFHLIYLIIPFETGWLIEQLQYTDFYSINGFIRNTFYNGWNSIFPWICYFMVGLYLGRLDWSQPFILKRVFTVGFILYLAIYLIQIASYKINLTEELKFFIQSDYLPPFLPFTLSTIGFGLMLLSAFMQLGRKIGEHPMASRISGLGKMTLTHYVSHVTIGMIILYIMSQDSYSIEPSQIRPVHPIYIFLFALGYFGISYCFTQVWLKRFKSGPLEMLMRRFSS